MAGTLVFFKVCGEGKLCCVVFNLAHMILFLLLLFFSFYNYYFYYYFYGYEGVFEINAEENWVLFFFCLLLLPLE